MVVMYFDFFFRSERGGEFVEDCVVIVIRLFLLFS